MKKLIFTLLLSTSSIYVWAQEAQDNEQSAPETAASTQETPKCAHKEHLTRMNATSLKPPNYGSLMIDWGFDFLRGHSSEMDLSFWESRFASIGLYYNIRLGHSHFAISPGMGIAFDGYRFKDADNTLRRNETSRNNELKKASTLFPSATEIMQSGLDVKYLDFMLEARFNANSKYPKESFFVAIGGKLGILWTAFTTVKYKEDKETKECNSWESFNLNQMRYGFHARLGWGRFGLCYTHMLSSLFNKDKGPGTTTIQPCSLGLSIDLF